jgi:hypothetical protein
MTCANAHEPVLKKRKEQKEDLRNALTRMIILDALIAARLGYLYNDDLLL